MCDTKSVLTVGMMAGLAMTGVGAAGALTSGLAGGTLIGGSAGGVMLGGGLLTMGLMQAYNQNEQAQAQAKILEQNRIASELQAQDAVERGAREEDKHRQQVRLLEGEQRAAMAAAGGELGSGTNAVLLDQTQRFGEMDALTIRSNAAREAWGYRTQANITGYQAELTSRKGRADAFGTVLTSGLQAFGTYRKG